MDNYQRLKSLMVDPDLHKRAKLVATENGETLQAFVERVLQQELKQAEKKAA